MRNKRSVWTVATQPFPEAHFATFPEKLIWPCILAGSSQGGNVLDPFGAQERQVWWRRSLAGNTS
ncbi:DNA methyltransferase [Brevibacillus brevis]|nr:MULTISPECIES: DNA methyltransferase [Brevibacillus]